MTLGSGPSFPRKFRLRKSSEFETVLRKGRRLNSSHYVIYCHRNSFGYPRLGTIVSAKRCGGAVKRNRIKRVLREVFRLNKHIFDSYDVVVLAKGDSHKLDLETATDDIGKLFERLS
ncbi:MAG: ribonuclease P protein component [Candidatus Dadabacteria bacterium]|nr:ribonuclease P protein component [Candidatus Dadabacteria bacterium]